MPIRIHRSVVSPLSREIVDRWGEVPASVAADFFKGATLIDPAIVGELLGGAAWLSP